jgi:LysR family transcriptional regulator for bpeEF and oprC
MVQILPDWLSDPLPVHVVYPQNRHLSAKVRVFVEWVAELFAANPYMNMNAAPRPALPAAA